MLRLKHKGGETVQRGTYWSFSTGERLSLEKPGVLPGDGSSTYYKAHPILILLAAPILGLVYAVFLPFIGITSVVTMTGRKFLGKKPQEIMTKLGSFGWRPAEAYFTGKKDQRRQKIVRQ